MHPAYGYPLNLVPFECPVSADGWKDPWRSARRVPDLRILRLTREIDVQIEDAYELLMIAIAAAKKCRHTPSCGECMRNGGAGRSEAHCRMAEAHRLLDRISYLMGLKQNHHLGLVQRDDEDRGLL